MPRRQPIDIGIASEFLSRAFAPSETIAIVLRRTPPATIAQRIVRVERALQPRYLGWLAHENATGANVYFAANPLISGSRKRTKESVAEIRHLYLDLDTDGDKKVAALRSSNTVPTPTAIVSTSPDKYQVLWRVESIPFEQQEALLKVLAITFGGDPASRARTDNIASQRRQSAPRKQNLGMFFERFATRPQTGSDRCEMSKGANYSLLSALVAEHDRTRAAARWSS